MDRQYDPEPGSALADVVRTENLEKAQQMDDGISVAQGYVEPWESTADFDRWIDEERENDEAMEAVHGKRKVNPEFDRLSDSQYPAGDIANLAYDYTRKLSAAGDERPDWDLRIEFYKRVYPELEGYLGTRITQPNESPYKGLDEFLLGEDLRTPRQ